VLLQWNQSSAAGGAVQLALRNIAGSQTVSWSYLLVLLPVTRLGRCFPLLLLRSLLPIMVPWAQPRAGSYQGHQRQAGEKGTSKSSVFQPWNSVFQQSTTLLEISQLVLTTKDSESKHIKWWYLWVLQFSVWSSLYQMERK